MDQRLYRKLEKLFSEEAHEDIITTIDAQPAEVKSQDDVIGHLARAYNNLERYQEASEALAQVSEKEREDVVWNFRIGYALYFQSELDKALMHFEIGEGEDHQPSAVFAAQCRQDLEKA